MNLDARTSCIMAQEHILSGHYLVAIEYLRAALRGTWNGRAKSKLMLAIRELKRAIN